MCSKHVEARNKLIVKQEVCASSWLIIEINGIVVFDYIPFPVMTFTVLLYKVDRSHPDVSIGIIEIRKFPSNTTSLLYIIL